MKDLGYLAQDISILHRKYYKDTSKLFEKIGLNPTAVCILLTIYDYPKINQNQVAKKLVIDKGLATREISKMQKNDYLVKVHGTGKAFLLSVTDKGKQIIPVAQKIRSNWWKKLLKETNLNENSPLISTIEKIVYNITNNC